MKVKNKYYVFVFLLVVVSIILFLLLPKVRDAKIAATISQLGALCYAINNYFEKNGTLPDSSANLLDVVFEDKGENMIYTRNFFKSNINALEYLKKSNFEYEILYEERKSVFKFPQIECNSDRKKKDIKLACNCEFK